VLNEQWSTRSHDLININCLPNLVNHITDIYFQEKHTSIKQIDENYNRRNSEIRWSQFYLRTILYNSNYAQFTLGIPDIRAEEFWEQRLFEKEC